MKYSAKLKAKYLEEINSWNWDKIQTGIDSNPQFNECGDIVGYCLIGSITGLYPSGKIYAMWTTNQTMRDIIQDQAFSEALEEVTTEYGFYIEHINDDVFICSMLDCEGEYYTTEDGETFQYSRDMFNSYDEVLANMEEEGFFPNVYQLGSRGDLCGYFRA